MAEKLQPFPSDVEVRLGTSCGYCGRGVIDGYGVIYDKKTAIIMDIVQLWAISCAESLWRSRYHLHTQAVWNCARNKTRSAWLSMACLHFAGFVATGTEVNLITPAVWLYDQMRVTKPLATKQDLRTHAKVIVNSHYPV